MISIPAATLRSEQQCWRIKAARDVLKRIGRALWRHLPAVLVFALPAASFGSAPMGTAFTYQGRLNAGGQPANGLYDFQFSLWDAATNGNSVAGPLPANGVEVTGGLFTVSLDFGAEVFAGQAGWLGISVRTNGGGDFTRLTPLQPLTAAPFALYALNSATAASLSGGGTASESGGLFEGAFAGDASGLTNMNLATAQAGNIAAAIGLTNQANQLVGTFAGNGSGLTNLTLPAASITGVISSSSLPPNVALLNARPTFSYPVFAPSFIGAFAGDGSGLTNLILPAASITGVISSFNLPPNVVLLNAAPTFSNPVRAPSFIGAFAGDGSGLTNLSLPAANLVGALSDSQLSANVALLNGTNLFGGSNVFAGPTLLTNTDNIIYGSFLGTVPATSLVGTIPHKHLSANVALVNGTNLFSGSNVFGGPTLLTNPDNIIYGSFSGTVPAASITGVISSSSLPPNVALLDADPTFSASVIAPSFIGAFAGDGSGLTNLSLPAANLVGALSDTQLSANVALVNGTNLFGGSNIFAGPTLLTNPDNIIYGSFSGAVPAASITGTISSSSLPANVALLDADPAFSEAVSAPSFSGSGAGLSDLNGNNLMTGPVSAPLGPQMIGSTNWTLGSGWSGSYTAGFAHSSGTAYLSNYVTGLSVGARYVVSLLLSNDTAGQINVSLGGCALTDGGSGVMWPPGMMWPSAPTAYYFAPTIVNANGLVITPLSEFNGTVLAVSIQQIVGTNTPVISVPDGFGQDALEVRISSATNADIFIGGGSGEFACGGFQDTAVGFQSLSSLTSGSLNTALGYQALFGDVNGRANTAVGASALISNNGDQNTALGAGALQSNTYGYDNIALGVEALGANTIGFGNTAVGGYDCMLNNTTGTRNVAVGWTAMQCNTSGSWNVAAGTGAMNANTVGSNNVAIGFSSMNRATTANLDVFVGFQSGNSTTTGSQNVGIGEDALISETSGFDNTAVGAGALGGLTESGYNVALGNSAGASATGAQNTLLGTAAGSGLTSGSGNIVLGAFVDLPSNAGSGQLNIGNLIFGAGLYNDTVMSSAPVSGTVQINGDLSASGKMTPTNGVCFPMATSAPTAASIGGTQGSVTNHLMLNVNGLLMDYWSDGTTLYSKQLAP